jgi:hypothetical protein
MQSSIRIIKRNQQEAASELQTSEGEISVERSTREMVSTVKSWIADFQQRKRTQARSFSPLTVSSVPRQPAEMLR